MEQALMGPSTRPHSAGLASVLGASDVEADALRTVPRHGAPCSIAWVQTHPCCHTSSGAFVGSGTSASK